MPFRAYARAEETQFVDSQTACGKLARVPEGRPDLISRACVAVYEVVHGKLHLPGAGRFVRVAARRWHGLQRYPFRVPEVGTAVLDFRDAAAFGMVNAIWGEFENERALLRAFSLLLRPGDKMWDVGANVGFLAQALARAPFELGRLDAFEPSPYALKTLSSLFKDHPRVHVHSIALGASNTTLEMQVLPNGSPLGSLVRDLPGAQRISVPVRRGDDYAAERNVPLPHLIKIDVEGFEPQVMKGIAGTIDQARPVIIFEHLWLTEAQVRELVPDRYQIVLLLDDGTVTRDFERRKLGANAILVPDEKIDCLTRFDEPP